MMRMMGFDMFDIEKSINGKTIEKVENCDESYIWIHFADGTKLQIEAVGRDDDPGRLFFVLKQKEERKPCDVCGKF